MPGKTRSVIYSPPKTGLPHLVVTIADGAVVDAVPVASHDAARAVLAERVTIKPRIAAEATAH